MKVVIIEYNAGNLFSVQAALNRLKVKAIVSNEPQIIQNADKVIFPGVGEMASAMKYLRETRLLEIIRNLTQPVLGICLGLQLFCRHSEENDSLGIGIFEANVKRFPPSEKVPHMGWNQIHKLKGPLFENIPDGANLYFVHSYYAEILPETCGESHYILPFSAAIQKENYFAVQFHPEKSGKAGEEILRNFLSIKMNSQDHSPI
ncbi:MAG TPA: imidazole glycerol phosphate synthase subunit HisH [Candidatus Marinimicrobia bacterium]|nr:imidazole glycerol phosphate synthase subunit HisH [Candidatus Neomarinimicrobiota bacterium]